jgi:heme-degrading monooxygenase HmoA
MTVARVAVFDHAPARQSDDERRVASLRELLQAQPGFVAGYHLLEEETGRMMSVSIWETDAAMQAGERAVMKRPAQDRRDIRPDRIERWTVEGTF